MRQIRKFLELPSMDRSLLVQSVFLLGVIRLGLWLLPFRSLRQLPATTTQATDQIALDRVTWAVDVSSRYVPMVNCLTRALVVQILLGRFGYPTNLRIGVARGTGGELQAHAWVESQGRVVLGGLEDLERYTPLPPLDGGRQ